MENFIQLFGQYAPGTIALGIVLWDYTNGKQQQKDIHEQQRVLLEQREEENKKQRENLERIFQEQSRSLKIIAEATARLDKVLQKHSDVASDIHEYVLGTVATVKNIERDSLYTRDTVTQILSRR